MLGLRHRLRNLGISFARCKTTIAVDAAVASRVPHAGAGDTDGPQPMSLLGKERIALGKAVALALDDMPKKPRYFLDNGTLLGLWRDGSLIENDDDFDFGVLVDGGDGGEFSAEWVMAFQKDLQVRLDKVQQSGTQYCSRVIDTYAHKIEVYDPSLGSFPLDGARYEGARYHHVSVDLQMHVKEPKVVDGLQMPVEELEPEDKDSNDSSSRLVRQISMGDATLISSGEVLAGCGVSIQHTDFATRGQVPGNVFEPFDSVHFAGSDWPVPGKTQMYLSFLYGYIGLGAELDTNAMLYRKRLVAKSDGDEKRPALRLYTDMCADLFHSGHVNYLKQCCEVAENVHLTVGIHSDATIQSYKRAPVCTMDERVDVMKACRFVDQVVPDAPLRVTGEFMDEHAIDFVVHGTDNPESERRAMYDVPIERGQYTEVPRTEGISTTNIIDRIASRLAVDYDEHALPSDRQPVVAVVRDILMK